jgi:methylisocitrate lyase
MTWLLDGSQATDHGTELRRLIETGESIAVPGAFNPLTAMIARRVGFQALYFSGAAFSAGMGIPDIGLFTLTELTDAVRWMVRSSRLPVIVDVDTGFGEAINVVRTVKELEGAGAAAVQIEDQVLPKRCGHLDGKTVVSADAFVEKVRAAVGARKSMLIIARTDSRATHGMDEAIERGRRSREAGADVIFPEAMESEDEFKAYADAVGGPLLANMTEFGKTPYVTVDQFKALGYQIVIFPVTTLRVAERAAEDVLREIKDKGTQKAFVDRMQTRAELYEVLEYARYQELDQQIALQPQSR